MRGLVTAVLLLGAALGSLLAGRLTARIGRRRTIWLLAATFVAGAHACAVATDQAALAASRFFLGLAVGGASVVVPDIPRGACATGDARTIGDLEQADDRLRSIVCLRSQRRDRPRRGVSPPQRRPVQ
ncbi:MAG: MFS transporter [Steroidobacteraceae bacterium]